MLSTRVDNIDWKNDPLFEFPYVETPSGKVLKVDGSPIVPGLRAYNFPKGSYRQEKRITRKGVVQVAISNIKKMAEAENAIFVRPKRVKNTPPGKLTALRATLIETIIAEQRLEAKLEEYRSEYSKLVSSLAPVKPKFNKMGFSSDTNFLEELRRGGKNEHPIELKIPATKGQTFENDKVIKEKMSRIEKLTKIIDILIKYRTQLLLFVFILFSILVLYKTRKLTKVLLKKISTLLFRQKNLLQKFLSAVNKTSDVNEIIKELNNSSTNFKNKGSDEDTIETLKEISKMVESDSKVSDKIPEGQPNSLEIPDYFEDFFKYLKGNKISNKDLMKIFETTIEEMSPLSLNEVIQAVESKASEEIMQQCPDELFQRCVKEYAADINKNIFNKCGKKGKAQRRCVDSMFTAGLKIIYEICLDIVITGECSAEIQDIKDLFISNYISKNKESREFIKDN